MTMRESLHLSSLRQVFFVSNSLSLKSHPLVIHSFLEMQQQQPDECVSPTGWFIDQPNNSTMSFFRPRHKRNQEEMEWNEKEMRREEIVVMQRRKDFVVFFSVVVTRFARLPTGRRRQRWQKHENRRESTRKPKRRRRRLTVTWS